MKRHVILKRAVLGILLAFSCSQAIAANPEWEQATRFYNSGDYKSALSAFQKIAEKMPRDASVHYMLGQCYKGVGNIKQATSELEWVSKYATDVRIKSGAAALLAQMKPSSDGAIHGGAIPGATSPYNRAASAGGVSTGGASNSGGGSSAVGAKPAATPPSKELVNGSISSTVSAAYRLGWVPCRNPECLNYGTNGWHHEKVDGYADTDFWMAYKLEDHTQLISQRHVGEIIKDGKDTGPCPKCNGSGWIQK